MDLIDKFCWHPFNFAEIHINGSVYVCCPRYNNNFSIGNIFTVERDPIQEIWNSNSAQDFRRGILEGTFACCSGSLCPKITAGTLTDRPAKLPNFVSEIMATGPSWIKFCHDNSCNLTCHSCRNEIIRSEQQQLDRIIGKLIPFFKDAEILDLSGSGDPFASKHYREIITSSLGITKAKFVFNTNGVLFDGKAWQDLKLQDRVRNVAVSIDAATEETYGIVRRGGDFARLISNLEFLMSMRKVNQISSLTISFVVQSKNFREMPAFIEMGKRLGVDRIYFSLIRDWGVIADFKEDQVWSEQHPRFSEFRSVLNHEAFKDAIVNLGDVSTIKLV